MTSFAFILGVVPLVIATGAGAGARGVVGTAVFGGMVLASFIGVLFVPALFAFFEIAAERVGRLFRRKRGANPGRVATAST